MALCLFVTAAVGAAPAGARSAAFAPHRTAETAAAAERQKVRAAVEGRTKDERTLARLREKVARLEGRKLRIAAALCDRLEHDGRSAGADIAFSLVAALLVLS